jgi:hypothetical protein
VEHFFFWLREKRQVYKYAPSLHQNSSSPLAPRLPNPLDIVIQLFREPFFVCQRRNQIFFSPFIDNPVSTTLVFLLSGHRMFDNSCPVPRWRHIICVSVPNLFRISLRKIFNWRQVFTSSPYVLFPCVCSWSTCGKGVNSPILLCYRSQGSSETASALQLCLSLFHPTLFCFPISN